MKKVFIQNCRTCEYLNDRDEWTLRRDGARSFQTSADAASHASRRRIRNARVIIQFGVGKEDVVLPMSECDVEQARLCKN